MDRTSHISDAYDVFSSSWFSFSSLLSLMTMNPTNQMMTDQGPGLLLVCAFCYEPEVNPDPEPSSCDSSESSSSDSRSRKKKRTKRKNLRKHRKDDSSDPYSRDDSDSSDDIHYRIKRRKDKKHRKKDTIRLCATLTAKLLTKAYKSKIIRFKMDEYPLQRQIYFLTFIDSLDIIFSQYRETCEVLLDYPKIGGDDVIEGCAKKDIRNILHANIEVHSRRLIAEFPKDGIKCIKKLQSCCANMTFSLKHTCFLCFSLSFGGLGHFEIM